MDNHMQFLKYLSLLKKHGLSHAISRIYFPSTKTWTIICNLWHFFPITKKMWFIIGILRILFFFSKKMDYHMQYLKFFPFPKNVDYHMQIMEFFSLPQKRGL